MNPAPFDPVHLAWDQRRVFRAAKEVVIADARLILVRVLSTTRELLAQPANDFTWSSWSGAAEAIEEIDQFMKQAKDGHIPDQAGLRALFLPTGPIQEVSLSSEWGDVFIALADQFEDALSIWNQANQAD